MCVWEHKNIFTRWFVVQIPCTLVQSLAGVVYVCELDSCEVYTWQFRSSPRKNNKRMQYWLKMKKEILQNNDHYILKQGRSSNKVKFLCSMKRVEKRGTGFCGVIAHGSNFPVGAGLFFTNRLFVSAILVYPTHAVIIFLSTINSLTTTMRRYALGRQRKL